MSLEQLHKACEAVAPILGVASGRIDFAPEATAQQRANANAILEGWDFSDDATAQRAIVQLRNKAQVAIDDAKDETIAISRAMLIEILDYENATRAAFNNLLQWLGTQTALTNRGQLAASALAIASNTQAIDRIKQRLAAGEADGQ